MKSIQKLFLTFIFLLGAAEGSYSLDIPLSGGGIPVAADKK